MSVCFKTVSARCGLSASTYGMAIRQLQRCRRGACELAKPMMQVVGYLVQCLGICAEDKQNAD
jgi:hypothetical protein